MKKLTLFSLFLAAVVIILGAYTRLTDAGLGCPDWPGCYGNLTVPLSDEKVDAANAAYPERPVEAFKAWNEMIHRYFAGTLGLCIAAIAFIAFRQRKQGTPFKLPLLLLGLVTFQAALGMWTVTLNLLPVVVMGHLLGGFSVLSCLFLLYLRLREADTSTSTVSQSTVSKSTVSQEPVSMGSAEQVASPSVAGLSRMKTFALFGVGVLVIQIALGGWTSANYAALACTDMPICEEGWQSRLDFAGAFSVPEAENYEFGAHDYGERATMHIVHRAGALFTFSYLLALGLTLVFKHGASLQLKRVSAIMIGCLFAQVALGVSNVVFALPLAVAVLHNAFAAILLLSLLWIVFSLINHTSAAPTYDLSVNAARHTTLSSHALPHALSKATGGLHG
ncbi:COX15/CtaA family protein [Alteromonas sp.]|uniref:COX15/CtaA family protein n=1 Tax=Alteromonas sp. TaxID=232 RepID=UPI000B72557B|nr:COX15/CtaA family protein [Alteromonas sp.]MAI36189.1 cytochrome B [Alteromonas sp.]OUX91776.1 MAG: cytochrome B [Alteromonas sp. TMED35]|tara:strand:- start:8833 stop:10008 length:1176 start_codon:yes stop_codon:yes gene_type:complete